MKKNLLALATCIVCFSLLFSINCFAATVDAKNMQYQSESLFRSAAKTLGISKKYSSQYSTFYQALWTKK